MKRYTIVALLLTTFSLNTVANEARKNTVSRHLNNIIEAINFRSLESLDMQKSPAERLRNDTLRAIDGDSAALQRLENNDYNITCRNLGTGGHMIGNAIIEECCVASERARAFFYEYRAGLPSSVPDYGRPSERNASRAYAALYPHLSKVADSDDCARYNRMPWYRGGGRRQH